MKLKPNSAHYEGCSADEDPDGETMCVCHSIAAAEVWPEAEGFERAPGGWTFRVGAGYASVTNSGEVATDPQGTRAHAIRFMPAAR